MNANNFLAVAASDRHLDWGGTRAVPDHFVEEVVDNLEDPQPIDVDDGAGCAVAS